MSDRVNILVVDDRAAQRLTIESSLADLDENIVCVSSGREALKFLLEHDAAVILLDVNMPGMDGFETASLIRGRARTADTPIIFLTADTDEMMAARGYALGAVDYLFCPFPPNVLRTKVNVFVTLSRVREQVRRDAQQQIALTREQAARAAAEEQGRRLHVLVKAGGVLAASLDGSAFEADLLRLLVPLLADEAGLVIRPRGDDPESTTWLAVDGTPTQETPLSLAPRLARALARGESETVARPGGQGTSVLILPLGVRGEANGVLCLAMRDSGRYFVDEDREIIDLVAGRIAVALDARRLYRELQERDRRKDEFLAMLSHELRNPLSAIATASGLLGMAGVTEAAASSARQIIARQSANLARIVDDLLEVSRVTAGRIAVTRAPMDLREAVEHAVDSLRAAGQLGRHQVDVGGDHALIEADFGRMEQVTLNLVVNAVKYTDSGGSIAIHVGVEDVHAVLTVTDNGIGISTELLPHLFDVFVQGRQSLDRARGGLGIGLTLVRKLVELQGGTIEARSPGPGRGSTFIVRMPLMTDPVAPRADGPAAAPEIAPLRVLVVEDNGDTREMLRRLLELDGHEVHEAADGPEAVERAVELRPNVVLVDLGLPGFDGFEVAHRLRAEPFGHTFTLVAVTGYGQIDDRRRSADEGFDAHLVKPISIDQLHSILALASRQASRAAAVGSG